MRDGCKSTKFSLYKQRLSFKMFFELFLVVVVFSFLIFNYLCKLKYAKMDIPSHYYLCKY